MVFKWKAFILLTLFPFSTLAFESLPEFQSLDEPEQELFENSELLGPEYTSDLVAYRKPTSWSYRWFASQKALEANVGSVSAKHFLLDNRLKVHVPLSRFLDFRFTYFQDQNREYDSSHTIFEIVAKPLPFAGISFYGEPALYKRKDDTGIAILLWPSSRHEIRLFHTFVDVTRLKRNDRTDTYAEPNLPYSRGVVGRIWSDPESREESFWEYALREETPTTWRFPDQVYEYQYSKWLVSVYGRKPLREGLWLQGRVQWDQKREGKHPTGGGGTVSTSDRTTTRFLSFVEMEWRDFFPGKNWNLIPGIDYSRRSWQSATDSRDISLIPYFWWELPGWGEGANLDRWRLGYQWVRRTASGHRLDFVPEDKVGETTHDHRLNVGYQVNFGEQARLSLMITGDLDKMFTRESWSGGNGQLQVLF